MTQKSKDPLFLGKYNDITKSSALPVFTSGKDVLDELEGLVRSEKPIIGVLNGSKEILEFFDTLFPELVESNSIGKLNSKSFEIWEPSKNEVTIELDQEPEL